MPIENKQSQPNDELTFLIACCQIVPSKEDIAFILSYLDGKHLNINTLIGLANQHGILPLMYKTIKNIQPLHDTLLTDLKSAYTQIAQRNILMSAELIRIMKLLEENDIKALAFKGPTLAQMAYGDITLRQYSDLDILIDDIQVSHAGKILASNNYKLLYPEKVLTNKTCLDTLIDVGFLHNNVHFELHWQLLQTKHTGGNSLTAPQNFTQIIAINSHPINTLENELLLVYLCLHGSKHAWERIEWICDLDRLIRAQRFDWEKAIEIAASSKLRRAFYLGLGLTHDFFKTPLPVHILNEIEKADINTLKQMTITKFNDVSKLKSNFTNNKTLFFYQLKLFESTSDQLRFILHSFFKISPADCITYTLPDHLKFLYIILRPLRLGWSYSKRIFIK